MLNKYYKYFNTKIYLIAVATAIFLVDIHISALTHIPFFGETDAYGVLHYLYPQYLVALPLILMGFVLSLTCLRKKAFYPPAIFLIAYIVLIYSHKFAVSGLDFWDSGWHLSRVNLVSHYGHTSPYLDPYFDVHPGFFYFWAAFFEVTGLPSMAVTKAYPFLNMALFMLALYASYRLILKD